MVSIFKSNYSSFSPMHEKSIIDFCQLPRKKKYIKSKFDAVIQKHFKKIVPDFAALISASPTTLFQLKIHFDRKIKASKDEITNSKSSRLV